MIYDWDDKKNDFLKRERNISFEEIVLYISEGYIVDILKHPNHDRYPNQKIYLVKRNNYIYVVPFVTVEDEGIIFLKTIFPSRKYTRIYLYREEENDG